MSDIAQRIGCRERRESLAHYKQREYFCTVVSEDVKIALKNSPSLSRKSNNELFVQCNQRECQYVDRNQAPCPLHLGLYAEEIEERKRKFTGVR